MRLTQHAMTLALLTLSLAACSRSDTTGTTQLTTQSTTSPTATFTTSSQWDSGFNGVITLRNPTSAPIKPWTLKFKLNGNASITGGVWGAGGSVTRNADGSYTILPNTWGGDTIPAGGTVTVNYGGSGAFSGVNSCTLNNQPCDGTTTPPGGDTTAPNVTLTASPTSLTAAGTATLTANATDNVGVTKVEFHRNGVLLSTDTTPADGFKASDAFSSSAQNGSYAYTAKAFDAAGNSRTSAAANVTVNISGTPPVTGGYNRVAYFTQWGIYGRAFTLKNVDASGAAATITHLNYAFGAVTPELTCSVTYGGMSDSFADYTKAFDAASSVDGVADTWDSPLRGNFNQIKKLKRKHTNLKALISLGGWTWSKYFSDAALTDASRKRLVSSCIDLYIKGNLPATDGAGGPGSAAGVFDGIDIDREYPASDGNTGNIVRPEDTQNFTLLLQEFRNQLDALGATTGKRYLLTAALPAAPSKIAKLEVAKIGNTLDLLNLMTYDFRGAWDATGPTNFHSNLYPSPNDPGTGETKNYSVDNAVQTYLQAGAPARKLIIGIPYYGRGWTGVPGTNNGLYQRATGAARGTYEAGYEDFKILKNAPGTVFRDAATKQMWKYDGTNFWSYDDPQVIADKTAYIKSKGLGGSMVWSLDGDDANASLSKAIATGLQ